MNLVIQQRTGKNEGDGKNNEEATVETDTKGCPRQSRLKKVERNTEKIFKTHSKLFIDNTDSCRRVKSFLSHSEFFNLLKLF